MPAQLNSPDLYTLSSNHLSNALYHKTVSMFTKRSRQDKIERILKALICNGAFNSAVVASKDGLPVAMVGKTNMDMIAAVAASMKDLAERAQQELTEITTRDSQGNKVVSRYFSVDEDLLLLAIQLPATCAYRRLTSLAIKDIQNVWST